MKCRECNNRESIIDDELMDVVGYKCKLTNTIIPAEVEDDLKEKCSDCLI